MTPSRISVALLAVAVAAGFGGWTIQASASAALEQALRLQSANVGDSDAAPPSVEENRQILDVLHDSIGIRKRIDALLTEVEGAVAKLERRQATSIDLARRGRDELAAVSSALGGAVGATNKSARKLVDLRGHLNISVRLAAAITRELRELDEKLGPSPGASS